MTVIMKINSIQIGPFQGFQKLRVGSGYKKAYVRELAYELKSYEVYLRAATFVICTFIIQINRWEKVEGLKLL